MCLGAFGTLRSSLLGGSDGSRSPVCLSRLDRLDGRHDHRRQRHLAVRGANSLQELLQPKQNRDGVQIGQYPAALQYLFCVFACIVVNVCFQS
jgi:hypothetical protein